MAYQSYKKIITLFIIAYGILLFMNKFGEELISDTSLFIITHYFAIRILSLFLLFFSIYAQISGVKGVRKLESPIIFIVLGAFLVILLIVSPIVGYFLTSDIKIETLSPAQLEEIKKETMNINIISGKRLLLVRKYYLETGERISYLDDNNKKNIYVPNDVTLKLRKEMIELKNRIALVESNVRTTALSLIGLLVISGISFLVFLWYKLKKT